MSWKKLEHSICDHVYTFLLLHYYSFENQCSFRPAAVNLRSLAKKNFFTKFTFSERFRTSFGGRLVVVVGRYSHEFHASVICTWSFDDFEICLNRKLYALYIKLYALTHTVLPHIYILRKPRKSKRSPLGIITSNVNYNFFLYVYILFLDSFLPFFFSPIFGIVPWYFHGISVMHIDL